MEAPIFNLSPLKGTSSPSIGIRPPQYELHAWRRKRSTSGERGGLHSFPSLVCIGGGGLDDNKNKKVINSANYVVPLDSSSSSSCITRPLTEILRDLNKRVPDNVLRPGFPFFHPMRYHANRMLSFYAPGWCGEIRDVIYTDNGSVTVVYRVTVRGSDGEAHREPTGTVALSDSLIEDAVAAAEEIAFCRACARFGLGLYLLHEDELV
ncbi:hypothetical protein QJS04_geneDACA023949 [Acorus gramineus]|uniref:DNA repair RAD52-like protein 2, chloroplastic n=1 Tax=Acorus gramineus TaxID=55184 RepID=A0AAV9B0S3_ACOGR|nr:hypothetical protein QJS04_geneDACA023949 [Acorus gramineus]